MITRRDVPYIAHPILSWIIFAGGVWGVVTPAGRMGATWLQFTIGLSVGLVSGLIGSYGLVRMLTYFASEARNEPKMKWYAFAWPLWGLGGILAAALWFAALFGGSHAVSALVDLAAHRISPAHFTDLVGTRELIPGQPMSMGHPELPVWCTGVQIAVWGRILLWYYHIPGGNQDPQPVRQAPDDDPANRRS